MCLNKLEFCFDFLILLSEESDFIDLCASFSSHLFVYVKIVKIENHKNSSSSFKAGDFSRMEHGTLQILKYSGYTKPF